MKFLKTILSLTAAGMFFTASAVPAKRGLYTVTQPDGTVLKVQQVGDEFMHFTLTDDNKYVTQHNGAYYWARIDETGVIVNTGVLAKQPENRTDADLRVMQSINDISGTRVAEMRRENAAMQLGKSRAIPQSGMGRFSSNFPRTGNVKGLVILVQYTDVKFKLSDPKSYFTNMLNQRGFNEYGGTGSAVDYFIENSEGKFTPQFDVYGPYTLPNNRSYYGANDSYGNDVAPEDMIVHACKGLDSQINFADYDCDNDGEVDNVFVFYAGQGEASSGIANTVWPHQWSLEYAYKDFKLDGRTINKYACSNEWENSRPDGVGTFIHEFSHVMGLPDLYHTQDGNSATPGEWSVLDYGPYNNEGRTPPAYSIYERNAMGWLDPLVLEDAETITLRNMLDSNEGCIVPTSKSTEFFLIENRQQKGWDTYLPNHGMLVWHIDFVQSVWDNNAVNNNANHMYVELEKANNSSYSTDGWCFPGSANKTSFTDNTRPSMKTWTGQSLNMPITNIQESNGIITFDIKGGGTRIATPELSKTATATDNGFTVSWSPVEGATDYLVTVSSISGTTVTENYDSSTLPDGWSKSSGISSYSSTGNYATGTCSLKLMSSGDAVTTRDYDSDVTYISFWYKGMGTRGSKSKLTINGKINGAWKSIQEIGNLEGNAERATISNVPEGVKAVQFIYTKGTGNLALDDITITAGGGSMEVLEGYEERSTGGATSISVELQNFSRAIATTYMVSVKATDGTAVSRESTITVDTNNLAPAGIDNILADGAESTDIPVYYNLQGIEVKHPQPGNIYIQRIGTRARKVIL